MESAVLDLERYGRDHSSFRGRAGACAVGLTDMPIVRFLQAGRSTAPDPDPVVDGPAALSLWPLTETARETAIVRLQTAVAGRTLDNDEAAAALGETAMRRRVGRLPAGRAPPPNPQRRAGGHASRARRPLR